MKRKQITWRADISAGLVVYLVALPLCLGVGLASTNLTTINGLPNVFSGIIAGIIGGIIVGAISNSRIGVSGPAAGLITIILAAIVTLGSFQAFLLAVMISGVIQLIAGWLKLGIIGNYFPTSVIKGMLAAIGITLILKEIPHAVGYDVDFFGDESFFQFDGHNTFSELGYAFNALHPGAIIVWIVSMAILIVLESKKLKRNKFFRLVPGAVIVVLFGVLINLLFSGADSSLFIDQKHLVQLPVASSINEFTSFFSMPDFSAISNPDVYLIALTIALVGSLESLLSVEATDKIDPEKHRTNTNRELIAQGTGNIVSGFFGGLPVTQVIVRSSANVNAGGKTKRATIIHGVFLALSVMFFPHLLNHIPLASLAAILIMVGYKLSSLGIYRQMFKLGWEQFLPFIATVVGVMFTDLLKGIAIGMGFAIIYILRKNYRNNYRMKTKKSEAGTEIVITLSEEVSFLNKGGIQNALDKVPDHATVIINGENCKEIDHDVLAVIHEFRWHKARDRHITLKTINIPELHGSGSMEH